MAEGEGKGVELEQAHGCGEELLATHGELVEIFICPCSRAVKELVLCGVFRCN